MYIVHRVSQWHWNRQCAVHFNYIEDTYIHNMGSAVITHQMALADHTFNPLPEVMLGTFCGNVVKTFLLRSCERAS